MRASSEEEIEKQEHHHSIARKLAEHMKQHGWKVARTYVARGGSVYLTLESLAEGYITKVRIADHEEQSDSHVTPEIQLIDEGNEFDWDEIANAIIDGEVGVF